MSTGRYQSMLRDGIVQCTDCSTKSNPVTLREKDKALHDAKQHSELFGEAYIEEIRKAGGTWE